MALALGPTSRAERIGNILAASMAFHIFVRFWVRAAQASEGGYGVMMADSGDTAMQVITRFTLAETVYYGLSLAIGLGDAIGTAFAVGHDANIKAALIKGIKSYGSVVASTRKWIITALTITATAYFFGALSPIIGFSSPYKNESGKAVGVPAGMKALGSFFVISQFMLYVFMNTDKPKLAGELAQRLITRRNPYQAISDAEAAAPLAETGPSIADYFCKENKIHWILAIPSCLSRGLIFAFSALKFATLVIGVTPTSGVAIALAAIAGTTAILMNLFTTVLFNLEMNAVKCFEKRNNIEKLPANPATPAAANSGNGWLDNWPKLLTFSKKINIPFSWLSYLSKAIGTGDFLLEVATLSGKLDLNKSEDLHSYTALSLVIGGMVLGAIANWQWRTQCILLGEKGAPRTLQTIAEDIHWVGSKVNSYASLAWNKMADACCYPATNGPTEATGLLKDQIKTPFVLRPLQRDVEMTESKRNQTNGHSLNGGYVPH